jgi:hypothetical protein
MLIGENWKVEADSLNVVLMKKRIVTANGGNKRGRKTNPLNVGKIMWDTIGYYSNVKVALWGMAKHEVQGSGLTDFETIVAKMDELEKLYKELPQHILKRGSDSIYELLAFNCALFGYGAVGFHGLKLSDPRFLLWFLTVWPNVNFIFLFFLGGLLLLHGD